MIYYIDAMKMKRLFTKEYRTLRFDLAVIATCIIFAAIVMGLYNLLS